MSHLPVAETMTAPLISFCNFLGAQSSLQAWHCGCSCNLYGSSQLHWLIMELYCDCSLQIEDFFAVTFVCQRGLSCLLFQVHELHCSYFCESAKCLTLAFVQVCELHCNFTCNTQQCFTVTLMSLQDCCNRFSYLWKVHCNHVLQFMEEKNCGCFRKLCGVIAIAVAMCRSTKQSFPRIMARHGNRVHRLLGSIVISSCELQKTLRLFFTSLWIHCDCFFEFAGR